MLANADILRLGQIRNKVYDELVNTPNGVIVTRVCHSLSGKYLEKDKYILKLLRLPETCEYDEDTEEIKCPPLPTIWIEIHDLKEMRVHAGLTKDNNFYNETVTTIASDRSICITGLEIADFPRMMLRYLKQFIETYPGKFLLHF